MSIARRLAFCALLAVALAAPAKGAEWTEKFTLWNQANEGRALGANNSAGLAWWESYLLQAYLHMYSATGDSVWLDRFSVHADTMLAVARDVPDLGACWPGYRDGFLGWGTDRYDPEHQYQEYMVHDGMACLPIARFSRMVLADSLLRQRYGIRARRYVDFIEANVVAKWYANWHVDRGSGEVLSSFGGWQNLPLNQSLVFGELLLVLDRIGASSFGLRTSGFYSEVSDSMAATFRRALLYQPESDAYAWHHYADASANPRWEDISHATLDISFALAEHDGGRAFSDSDLVRFGNTLTRIMWTGGPASVSRTPLSPEESADRNARSGFRRFVNGSGTLDSTGNLSAWLRLAEHQPDCFELVRRVMEANPGWLSPTQPSAAIALVLATLAELQPRFPDNNDPHVAVEEMAATDHGGLSLTPSPFAARVSIGYLLAARTPVSLRVYDASGRLVRTLVEQEQEPGPHQSEWRGDDNDGRLLPSGTYMAILTAGPRRLSRHLTLLR